MMEIRSIRREDEQDLFSIMRQFYDSPAVLGNKPDEVLRRDIADCLSGSPYVECFVAVEDGRLAAYAMVARSYSTEVGGQCIWIEDLCVVPEYRHRGLGRGLLRFVEQRYAGVARRFRLEVEPENEAACALYQSFGYEILPYQQRIKDHMISGKL